MASDKDILSALIRIGQLTRQEREAFEGMWDQVDGRRGKLSPRQRAWAEKVYFAQKLDQPMAVRPPKEHAPRIAFAYDAKVKRVISASSLEQFETMCPHVTKGGKAYQRVEHFFRTGGHRFELRPKPKEPKPPEDAET